MEHVTYDNMSNFINDDIRMRAAKFAANKLVFTQVKSCQIQT